MSDDDAIRPEHHQAMNEIARIMDEVFNQNAGAKKYGFALLVFDFGTGGFMNYISNAQRETMCEAMQEFIRRQIARN